MGEEEHFELRHIWETLTDWQVYMHILIYMSIIAPRAYTLFPELSYSHLIFDSYTVRSIRNLPVPAVSPEF